MNRKTHYSSLFLAVISVALSLSACQPDDKLRQSDALRQSPTERLVTTAWLAEHLADDGLVIIDTRPTPEYLAGHIPNAVSVSFDESLASSNGRDVSYGGGFDLFANNKGPLVFQDGATEDIERALRKLGVHADSKLVIYDAGAHFHAARFFFTLESHGFDNALVLDGGFMKWRADGHEQTNTVPQPTEGDISLSAPRGELVVDTNDVLLALSSPRSHVITSLTPEWHYGVHLAYSQPGHIPHAKLVPMIYFFNPDGTWRSKAQLAALLEISGIGPDDPIITYCGGNPLSGCSYFTFKHVLGRDVKMYEGALIAWLADERDLKLHTYQHPELLRETDWIQWWAGDRIQILLMDPPAVVVDVRSAAEYADGHIPWSVNIPMDKMTNNKLDTWASTLGAHGVGNNTEVVLCDEGLSPRAAAAFWLLEYMGHTQVSFCGNGITGWNARYGLTQKETLITEPTHPRFDAAIHPTSFTIREQPNKRLVASDDATVHRAFPRVWVVSSESVPVDLPVSEFVHLPWSTAMFDDNGALKSAGSLWQAFDQAGASFFDEVVCAGETVGDAAMCYTALRLLGYPTVRVYVPAESAL